MRSVLPTYIVVCVLYTGDIQFNENWLPLIFGKYTKGRFLDGFSLSLEEVRLLILQGRIWEVFGFEPFTTRTVVYIINHCSTVTTLFKNE